MAELRTAFGIYDEQEQLFQEMMTLTPAQCGGTLASFVAKFRRLYNRIERPNVPAFVVTKSIFLLNLGAGMLKDLRPRLLGVDSVPGLFHVATTLLTAEDVPAPMELDAFAKSKPKPDSASSVKLSKAPPHLRCHKCTGYGHFFHECPSSKKWVPKNGE